MSEEQSNGSAEEAVNTEAVSEPTPAKDEYVPRSAYEEVSRDMHKNKARLKEERARANALEAQLKADHEAKLAEEGKWKELFEKAQVEKEEAERVAGEQKRRNEEFAKRSALKQELGNVRDAYLVHADLSKIEIDETGAVSSETVREVANQFREEHASLLPGGSATKITSKAAASAGVVTQTGEKSLADMTTEEKMHLYATKKLQG